MNYRLSVPDIEVADVVGRWLTDHIARPHPKLRREGPICPFVVPALRAGTLTVAQHRWRGSHDVDRMVELIEEIVSRFRRTPTVRRNDLFTSVVVITGLPESAWGLIDEGHRRARHGVVAAGHMLGQFHPNCAEPSVHNPSFRVNRAPYPLFAIRRMSLHDILFLQNDPLWFEHYRRLFGDRYGGGRVNAILRALYEETCRRYAVDDPS